MFNPFGLAGTAYGQTDPPGCEIQCSTMFNQCSTHLRLLGLLMAKYGHFGPKKAVFERFWGPLVTFFGAIKAQTDPPRDVFDNVQPCLPNVQPIWACWDCLWPNMAFLGKKLPFLAIKMARTTEI